MPFIIPINREEILELTRRMTLSRTSMTRIAGSYMDSEGFIDGTFNTNFLKLQPKEKEKNLAIAKIIPFSPTNKNLKRYILPENACRPGGIRQLLLGMKSSALKNDARKHFMNMWLKNIIQIMSMRYIFFIIRMIFL